MTKAVTIEIDDQTLDALQRAAAGADQEPGAYIADALRVFAGLLVQEDAGEWEPSEEDLAAIREGSEAADRGEIVSHDEVMEGARRIIDGEAS